MRMPGLLLVPLAMVAIVSSAQARPSASVALADDVRDLGAAIEEIHPAPFRSVSRQRFQAEVNTLAQRAERISRDELLVGLMRMIALLGPRNGHTGLFPGDPGHTRELHFYPLRLYDFADGLYVVLDLQPGRASLLSQAEHYQSLLALPDVGLALDAEWKLQPGQKPLRQIGHVDIGEVNGVVNWLATLTARHHLPQKLLVLHQFQLAMLSGEQHLDTSRDDLAIVIHMDGQGTPGVKQGTWDAVTAAAPPKVFFGWKNFLVKDHPMLTPSETMTKTPAPVMISYQ